MTMRQPEMTKRQRVVNVIEARRDAIVLSSSIAFRLVTSRILKIDSCERFAMFLVSVPTPFLGRILPAIDTRDALTILWALAGQGFKLIVLDEGGREVSLAQLEARALDAEWKKLAGNG